MNLPETLGEIAQQLGLDPVQLKLFASEDTIGGYSSNAADRRWMVGSLYGVEGQTLYALVRALQPEHVAEIGSLRGCSTTHLATALNVNGHGKITAIDIAGGARDQFPASLESVLTPVTGDGLEWLAGQPDESIDIIFEDSSHGEEMCRAIAALARTKLTPGGLLIMHDAAHDFANLEDGNRIPSEVGATIRRGLDKALGGGKYHVYRTDPSDCGFAIWRRPVGNMPTMLDDGYSYQGLNEVDAQANEKPIRLGNGDSIHLAGKLNLNTGEETIEGAEIERADGTIEPLKVTPDFLRSGQPLPENWNLTDGKVYNEEGEVIAQARSMKTAEELPDPSDKKEGQIINDPEIIAQLTAPVEPPPPPKKKPGRKPKKVAK